MQQHGVAGRRRVLGSKAAPDFRLADGFTPVRRHDQAEIVDVAAVADQAGGS